MNILHVKNKKLLLLLVLVFYPYLMALSKIILGILTPSVFLFFYAAYDIGIGLAKTVDIAHRYRKPSDEDNFCAYIIGWFMFSSSLLFMIYSLRIFLGGKIIIYSFPITIVISVSTFIILGSVIIRFYSHKKNDSITKAVRLIDLCSVIISLAVTREALLYITVIGNTSQSACLAGLIFGGITAIISIHIINSVRKLFQKKKTVINRDIAHKIVKESIFDFLKMLKLLKRILSGEINLSEKENNKVKN